MVRKRHLKDSLRYECYQSLILGLYMYIFLNTNSCTSSIKLYSLYDEKWNCKFLFHLFILLVKNNVFFSFCQREQLTWSQTNILLNVIYLIICSNCIVHKVLYVVLIVTFFTHYIIFIIHTPLMKVKIVKCLCTDLFIILQKI